MEMAGGGEAAAEAAAPNELEPETLAMVAWALGFFAERFKNHGDAIIYLGEPQWGHSGSYFPMHWKPRLKEHCRNFLEGQQHPENDLFGFAHCLY